MCTYLVYALSCGVQTGVLGHNEKAVNLITPSFGGDPTVSNDSKSATMGDVYNYLGDPEDTHFTLDPVYKFSWLTRYTKLRPFLTYHPTTFMLKRGLVHNPNPIDNPL